MQRRHSFPMTASTVERLFLLPQNNATKTTTDTQLLQKSFKIQLIAFVVYVPRLNLFMHKNSNKHKPVDDSNIWNWLHSVLSSVYQTILLDNTLEAGKWVCRVVLFWKQPSLSNRWKKDCTQWIAITSLLVVSINLSSQLLVNMYLTNDFLFKRLESNSLMNYKLYIYI